MNDEKVPLNEVKIDALNFRTKLKSYSIKELDDYLKNYERYGKDFDNDSIFCLPTLLAERKGKYRIDGKGRRLFGVHFRKGELIVDGDVDGGTGFEMESGIILINGSAAIGTGLFMKGGTILIKENTGDATGENMEGGLIICFGKIEDISNNIHGGLVYANEYKNIPKNMRKYTHSLYDIFSDSKKDEQTRYVLKNYKDMFFPFANNFERQKQFAKILKTKWKEVAFEYEKSLMW